MQWCSTIEKHHAETNCSLACHANRDRNASSELRQKVVAVGHSYQKESNVLPFSNLRDVLLRRSFRCRNTEYKML